MTTKERAVLKGIASTADTILIIGKGGITENVVEEAKRALAARELVKGRVLETCMLTAKEALQEIAELTGAEPVQAIGSKFIIYKENKELPEEKRIKPAK